MSRSFVDAGEEAVWDAYSAHEEVIGAKGPSLSSTAGVSALGSYRHAGKKDLEYFPTISMPPTDEQIQQTGGFQTPSLTSKVGPDAQSNGGPISSCGSPGNSNVEHTRPRSARPNVASSSTRSFVSSVHNAGFSNPEPEPEPCSILSKLNRVVHGMEEELPTDLDSIWLSQDNEWITEISWTEEDVVEAAELEEEADEAYLIQMAALQTLDRTYEWVRRTSGLTTLKPFGQILRSDDREDESRHNSAFSGFSGFSPMNDGRIDEEKGNDDESAEDLFKTPPSRWSLPAQATFELPLARPLVPGSSAAKMAHRRVRQISPCAYRSGCQADFLYTRLQQEIGLNEEPHTRGMHEREAESKQISRLLETSPIATRDGNVDIAKLSDLDSVLSHFDRATNEIIEEVKAANDQFFDHGKALLERGKFA